MKRITKVDNGYQFPYLFPVWESPDLPPFSNDGSAIGPVGRWHGDIDRGVAWAEDLRTAETVYNAATEGAVLFECIPTSEELRDIDWYDGGVGLINAFDALRRINAPVWCVAIRGSQVRFDFNGISVPAAYILGAIGRWDNPILEENQRGVVIWFD